MTRRPASTRNTCKPDGAATSASTSVQFGYMMMVPQTDYLKAAAISVANVTAPIITGPSTVSGALTVDGTPSASSTSFKVLGDYSNSQNLADFQQKSGADIGHGLHIDKYGSFANDILGVDPFTFTHGAAVFTIHSGSGGWFSFNGAIGFPGGSSINTSGQYVSTVATGTAPLS